MNDDKNVKTVRDAYSAYEDHDIPALLEHLTDDVRWFEVGPRDLIPTAGMRKGRKQVEEFFDTLEAREEVQVFKPQQFVAQGEVVVVLGELKSRVKSTGRMIVSPWVHVFTLNDGKISEFRSFYDSAAAAMAYEIAQASTVRAGRSGTGRAAII